MIKKFILYIIFLFSLISLRSATYTAVGCPGPVNWTGFSAGGSPFWNGGTQLTSQPAAGDILVVPAGCTVNINNPSGINVTNSITINVYGQLAFDVSTKLDMANGSLINVLSGGSLSGISNSNQIKIGTGGSADLVVNGTFNGPFQVNQNGNTLPIELLDFSATCVTNGVLLKWTTATEKNNDYFLIERSNDGINWIPIGKVDGNGTTTEGHKYVHEDLISTNKVFYYRLVQFDFDGKNTTHKIVDAYCDVKAKDELLLYPNPSSTELNALFTINKAISGAELKVMNMSGQILMDTKIDLQEGLNTFSFPIDFQSGTYQVLVSSGDVFIPAQKIVVVKL